MALTWDILKPEPGLTLLPREFVTIVPHRLRTDCTALSESVGPAKLIGSIWNQIDTGKTFVFLFFYGRKGLGED